MDDGGVVFGADGASDVQEWGVICADVLGEYDSWRLEFCGTALGGDCVAVGDCLLNGVGP